MEISANWSLEDEAAYQQVAKRKEEQKAARKVRRKTTAQIRADAVERARDEMLGEVCRVLRHHLDMEKAGSALWKAYASGTPLQQREAPQSRFATWYAPYDLLG